MVTPKYNELTFDDIYPDSATFIADMGVLGIPKNMEDPDYTIIWSLLEASYGDTPLSSNYNETRWKMKIQSIIWQYGPEWKRKLEIQDKLRTLTDDEILTGTKTIYNHAYNPSEEPSTQSLEELNYINDQNTTNYKLNKMQAYTALWGYLSSDMTKEFIDRFKPVFSKFTMRDVPLFLYSDDEEAQG